MPRNNCSQPLLYLLLIVSVLTFANCSHLAIGRDVAHNNIAVDEVLGTWTFNRSTLDGMQRLKSFGLTKLSAQENTITLEKDGTCHFNTYTVFHPYGYHLISDGRWQLKKRFDHALNAEAWQVEMELSPGENDTVITSLFVKKRGDHLVMYDFIDDPDQNQFVEFELRRAK